MKPDAPLYVQSHVRDAESVPRIDTEGIQSTVFKKYSEGAGKSADFEDLDEMEEWDDDEYGEEFYLDEEYEEESEGSVED